MGDRLAPPLLLVVVLMALAMGAPATALAQTLRIHTAVTDDAPGDTTGMTRRPLVGAPGQTVLVGDPVLDLQPSSLQTVGFEEDGEGEATLSLWLSDDVGQAFAALTERSVGSALAVVYDGRVLMAPVVQARIPNGHVLITGLTVDEGARVARELRAAMAGTPEASSGRPDTGPEVEGAGSDSPVRDRPPRRFPREPGVSGTEPLPLPPSEPVAIPPLGESSRGEVPPRREAASPSVAPPLDAVTATAPAEAAALAFVRAVARRDWATAADALHPAALASLRPVALDLLRLDRTVVRVDDGRQAGTLRPDAVLGRSLGRTSLSDLSDRDLAVLYLAGLEVLGVWGPAGPPRSIAGAVAETPSLVYVLLRPDAGAQTGVVDVTVVTVRLDASGVWRPLLTQVQGY